LRYGCGPNHGARLFSHARRRRQEEFFARTEDFLPSSPHMTGYRPLTQKMVASLRTAALHLSGLDPFGVDQWLERGICRRHHSPAQRPQLGRTDFRPEGTRRSGTARSNLTRDRRLASGTARKMTGMVEAGVIAANASALPRPQNRSPKSPRRSLRRGNGFRINSFLSRLRLQSGCGKERGSRHVIGLLHLHCCRAMPDRSVQAPPVRL
jgi:hypothetical protein